MADWMMSMPWEASHGFFALWLAFEKYPSAAFPHPSSLDVRSSTPALLGIEKFSL